MLGASLLSLALLICPPVEALWLRERDVPAVVGLDIERKHVSDPAGRDRARRKRDKTVSQLLDNEVRFQHGFLIRFSLPPVSIAKFDIPDYRNPGCLLTRTGNTILL
jgi:hypothetical protein